MDIFPAPAGISDGRHQAEGNCMTGEKQWESPQHPFSKDSLSPESARQQINQTSKSRRELVKANAKRGQADELKGNQKDAGNKDTPSNLPSAENPILGGGIEDSSCSSDSEFLPLHQRLQLRQMALHHTPSKTTTLAKVWSSICCGQICSQAFC